MCACLETLTVLLQTQRVLAVAARGVRLVAAHLGGEGSAVALLGSLDGFLADLLVVLGVVAVHTVAIEAITEVGKTLAVKLQAAALLAVTLEHTHRRVVFSNIFTRWSAMMCYLRADVSRTDAWWCASLESGRADAPLARARARHFLLVLGVPIDSMASAAVAPMLLRLGKSLLLDVRPCTPWHMLRVLIVRLKIQVRACATTKHSLRGRLIEHR